MEGGYEVQAARLVVVQGIQWGLRTAKRDYCQRFKFIPLDDTDFTRINSVVRNSKWWQVVESSDEKW